MNTFSPKKSKTRRDGGIIRTKPLGIIQDRNVIGILYKTVSQKLQLNSDLTLEIAIQITPQSEMVKSQATDQNCLTSNDLEEVQSKKKPVNTHWRKGKG